jgi:DNA-binding transcriptional LysR family regulator
MVSIKALASASAYSENGLTLEQLRYFLAAAQLGNFTEAARASRLSQSAFSRQIQALESALGVKVFDRVGRKVRINEAGRELEAQVADILRRVARLRELVGPASVGLRGALRLGANISVGVRHLPTWLATFNQAFPQVETSLRLGLIGEMLGFLRADVIDVAIIEEPWAEQLAERPALEVFLRFPEELWVIGPAGVDPEAPPPRCARWFTMPRRRAQLASIGVNVEHNVNVPSVDVAQKFVEGGLGYSLVPAVVAQEAVRDGKVTRLSQTLMRHNAFVALADAPLSPCAQRFLDHVRPCFEEEAARYQAPRGKRRAV